MNAALRKAERWASSCGLKISPEKTVSMLFTNKNKKSYKIPSQPFMVGGKAIKPSTETKYLGVILDNKLNWASHINHKLNQARKVMFMIKSTTGKLWGPSPDITLWAYKSMVRPIISYCFFVFAQAYTKTHIDKLKKLQRQALLNLSLIHI